MNFAKRLIQLREEKGLSQKELAKELGVSRGAISLWETDKRQPKDFDTLKRLADYFETTLDFIIIGEEKEENITLSPKEAQEIDNLKEQLNDIYSKLGRILSHHTDSE